MPCFSCLFVQGGWPPSKKSKHDFFIFMKATISIALCSLSVLSAPLYGEDKDIKADVAPQRAVSTTQQAAKPTAPMSLQEAQEYLSYHIGVDIASRLQSDDLLLIEQIKRGFLDSLAGKASVKSIDVAKMQQAQEVLMAAQMKKSVEKEQQFLAEHKKQEGVQVTPSGLQYHLLKKAEKSGKKPQSGDAVRVHYTGKLTDGTVFDSSVERGEPVEFPLNAVIAGWTEGLQLMQEGDKMEFVIPSELGYGVSGTPDGRIPPHAPLVFEIELIKVLDSPSSKAK